MATRTPKARRFHGPPADRYGALVAALPPRPLHDKTDYEHAVAMIGRLVGYELNGDQQDYLEAITVFVERYEREHAAARWDTGRARGLDVLRSLVKEHAMSGADLSRLLGVSRTVGSMILRGERAITAKHARTLGEHFCLDPGVFIR